MSETTITDRLLSVPEFLERNNIGVTTFYRELSRGRLVAVKIGDRTLVAPEAERAWRNNLPRFRSQQRPAAA
jgi:predicted DNA-binding transcriptional regulator AlpA